MTARLAPIAPVLAALERWRPVYLRWCDHPCRRSSDDLGGSSVGRWEAPERSWTAGEPVSAAVHRPWSAGEQARLDRLASTDPDSMATSADRFDAVAAELTDIGRSAGVIGASVGPGAAASCTALAAVIESEASQVTALAGELRAASARLDTWLTELVRQVLRVGDGVRDGGAYRSSVWLAQRDADEADAVAALVSRYPGRDPLELAEPAALARWTRLDELVRAHGAVLAVLHAGLAAADGWEAGPGSARDAGPLPWAAGDAESGPGRPRGVGVWGSEGPAPVPDVVVGREYRDRVLGDWEPLRPAIEQGPVGLPGAPGAESSKVAEIRPGAGPVLAGVEGQRVGTETGVRVAELPDAPAGWTRRSAR